MSFVRNVVLLDLPEYLAVWFVDALSRNEIVPWEIAPSRGGKVILQHIKIHCFGSLNPKPVTCASIPSFEMFILADACSWMILIPNVSKCFLNVLLQWSTSILTIRRSPRPPKAAVPVNTQHRPWKKNKKNIIYTTCLLCCFLLVNLRSTLHVEKSGLLTRPLLVIGWN